MTSARNNSNSQHGADLPPVPSIPLSDYADAAEGQSIGSLVREATTQLSTLVRAELELAKIEIGAEIRKGLKGSVFFILALAVLAFSTFFLFFTFAELLSVWLPRWAGFGIVFGLMLLTVALFAFLGYRKVRKIRGPQRTIESMKENVEALRNSFGHPDEPTTEQQ